MLRIATLPPAFLYGVVVCSMLRRNFITGQSVVECKAIRADSKAGRAVVYMLLGMPFRDQHAGFAFFMVTSDLPPLPRSARKGSHKAQHLVARS